MSNLEVFEATTTIAFSDRTPIIEGLYLFRKSERHTECNSWRVVKVYMQAGVMWMDTPYSTATLAVAVDTVGTGQFSINRFLPERK